MRADFWNIGSHLFLVTYMPLSDSMFAFLMLVVRWRFDLWHQLLLVLSTSSSSSSAPVQQHANPCCWIFRTVGWSDCSHLFLRTIKVSCRRHLFGLVAKLCRNCVALTFLSHALMSSSSVRIRPSSIRIWDCILQFLNKNSYFVDAI